MSRKEIKQLRHPEPEQRIIAIKAVARSVDRNALKRLAIMSGDDPDADVREMARKAGVYIRQQIGQLPKPPQPEEKKKANGKPEKIPVDAKAAKNGQHWVTMAMNAQLEEDKGRMIKALQKALRYDPNLQHEAFLISLCEAATGKPGMEAVTALNDTDLYEEIVQAQTEQKKQTTSDDHETMISSATWRDAGLDVALLALIVTVGTIIGLFLQVQSANAYINKVENNLLAVQEARLDGRVQLTDDGDEFFISTELNSAGKPKLFTLMQPDRDFLEAAERIAEKGISQILLGGVGMGIAAALGAVVLAGLAHLLAGRVFRGHGALPYLMHKATSLLAGRVVILLVLAFIGLVVVYDSGGGMQMIFLGAMGVFSLFIVLSLLGIVRQSYRAALVPGLVATMGGVTAMSGIIGAGLLLLVM